MFVSFSLIINASLMIVHFQYILITISQASANYNIVINAFSVR